jgi:hypothetical protein
MLLGTVGATVEDTIFFHAVTDDAAATMRTSGCQGVDRTFKAVKDMSLTADSHFKTFIVNVSAHLTSHTIFPGSTPTFIHDLPLSTFASGRLAPS